MTLRKTPMASTMCRGTGLARLCPDCDGIGHHRSSDTRPCDGCDGSGQVA